MKHPHDHPSNASSNRRKKSALFPSHAEGYGHEDLVAALGKAPAQAVVEGFQAIRNWAESEGESPVEADLQSGYAKPNSSRFQADGGQSWLAANPMMSFDISESWGQTMIRQMADSKLICDVSYDGGEAHYHFTSLGRRTFTRLMYPDIHEAMARIRKREKLIRKMASASVSNPGASRLRA